MSYKAQAQLLLISSAICLMLSPALILMSAFSPSASMIALTLTIMGGLGLFAAMKAMARIETNKDTAKTNAE